jgi:hypothetical protein
MTTPTDKFSQTAPISNSKPSGGPVPTTTSPLPRPTPPKEDRVVSKVIVYGR